jgi:hypothetical protein
MASFLPSYGKKHAHLAELEREFLRILGSRASDTELAEAAETIRCAQVRALKEKRQEFAPSENNARLFAEVDGQIKWWAELSNDGIVERYRDAKVRGKITSRIPKRWRRGGG